MSLRKSMIAVAILLAAVPIAARATTIHVPLDQPTIQQGLDAASDGDTVLVAPGTYTGALNRDLDFAGKNLTLRAEGGVLATIIDCEDLGRAFYFHSGEDTTAVVLSFTVQNAAADSGAGVVCANGSSPTFTDCHFLYNTATIAGGAAYCHSSSPVFWFCIFEGNESLASSGVSGGAITCMAGSAPALRNCVFAANTSMGVGGAASCVESAPIFTECEFAGNSAADGGGGMYAGSDASPTVVDCLFVANTGGQGGAIYTQSSSVSATGCVFAQHGYRALTFLYDMSGGQISHCTFVNNLGHVHCFQNADPVFSNCTFVGSTDGGAVTMYEASPTFENSIFAFSTDGPVASCQTGTENPVFTRCVLFSNTGGEDLCGTVSDTLHRDPLFCDMVEYEFDLCQNSVCAAANNGWNELIGAEDVGCPDCASAVEPTTWGAIKALYR